MWCAKSMGAAVRGLCLGKDWTSLGRISIDTRTLRPGDIFVAIKGKTLMDTASSRRHSAKVP